jgi:hypothetical protein
MSRSPGKALMALGAGHTVWGLLAYREPLRELARAGFVDGVGDGLFRAEHSRDARAAAFWFMAAAPLVALGGYLADAAEQAGDRRATAVTGGAVLSVGAAGMAVIPRSGFPAGVSVGLWFLARARRMP